MKSQDSYFSQETQVQIMKISLNECKISEIELTFQRRREIISVLSPRLQTYCKSKNLSSFIRAGNMVEKHYE
jgi:hypothetical protein